MPYEQDKNPYRGVWSGRTSPGQRGKNITLTAGNIDLDTYAYLRVFVGAGGVIKYVPAANDDADIVTMTLTAGGGDILPHLVRRIIGTAGGTTAGLEIITILP